MTRWRVPGAAAVLFLLAWGFRGEPAIAWMNATDLTAIDSPGDAWRFLVGLRTGVSPLLGGLEAVWLALAWDLDVLARVLYPAATAGAFAVALAFARLRAVPWFALLAVTAFVVRVGLEVSRGNPQVYDVVFPLLLLGALLLVRRYLDGAAVGVLVAAGILLAAAELTRPFMVYLLPVLLVAVLWLVTRRPEGRLRAAMAVLVPVLLISGGWHLHLLLSFGQVAWSNHAGFNMARSWGESELALDYPDFVDAYVPPDHEVPAAQQQGSFNSEEHTRVSEAMKSTIVEAAMADPGEAVSHVSWRVAQMLVVPTTLIYHDVEGPIFVLYRVVVATFLLGGIAVAVIGLSRASRGAWRPSEHVATVIGLALTGAIVLNAAAERGEEARLVFSLTPLALAACGCAVSDARARRARRQTESAGTSGGPEKPTRGEAHSEDGSRETSAVTSTTRSS